MPNTTIVMTSTMSVPLFDVEYFVRASQTHAVIAASAASALLAYVSVRLLWWKKAPSSTAKAPAPNGLVVGSSSAEKQQQPSPLPLPLPSPSPIEPAQIDALLDFQYARTPPEKFRPYKPKYHLTMAIEVNPANDIVLLDDTYRRNLAYRRHLILAHPSTVLGCLPSSGSAVQELYTYLLRSHLPARFPTHFSLTPSGTLFHNHVTTQTHPVVAPSTRSALKILGENLDTDYILLQPDAEGVYRVSAFVVCFPNGFDMSQKIGWRMSQIHAPVPGLESKLGKSIERFFGKMEPGVGRGVRRLNWSLVRSPELYTPTGNHVYDDAAKDMGSAEEIDPENCCLRVERQTLFKLPESGAIAFGIKTYITPLSEIKREGGGETFATAIEGLGSDDAEIARYKGRGIWGEKVLEYLRA